MEFSSEDDHRQTKQWRDLYDRILEEMENYGVEDTRRPGDFWIDTDNFGTLQHKIYVFNLRMLKPDVIASLQKVLQRHPSWEIVYAVAVSRMDKSWPAMWLVIRKDEILDALQLQYMPSDYQSLIYAGGRPLTSAEWARYRPDDQ